MTYRLRSDLSKTTVYMVMKQFAPAGITLPTVRKCEFHKHRGSYWMFFDFDGHRFKSFFGVGLGHAYVSYDLVAWDMDSSSAVANEHFRYQVVNLTADYLLANKLLREVA